MNFSAIFPSAPNHISDWIFPLPVNPGFLFDFYTERKTHWQDSDVSGKVFVIEATKNKTAQYGAGNPDSGQARDASRDVAVVHVGDVLSLEWRARGLADERIVEIDCRMCSLGPKEGDGEQRKQEAEEDDDTDDDGEGDREDEGSDEDDHTHDEVGEEAQGILTACDGYSDSHVSDFLNRSGLISRDPTAEYPTDMAKFDYQIPSLYREVYLLDRAVGVCVLLLRDPTQGEDWDYTGVFAVRQSKRATPKRFSAAYPAGVEDPSIAKLDELTIHAEEDKPETKSKGLKSSEISGIVLGALLGVALSLGLVLWVFRRKKKRTRTNAGAQCREGGEEWVHMGPNGRAQRGGVVRDVETERDDDGEVPPAYHEVVNMKNDRY